MSSAPDPTADTAAEEAAAAKGGGKKKLILLAVPLLLGSVGAGLWFSGIIPKMLGKGETSQAHATATAPEESSVPVFVELPEIVANLNSGTRKTVYVKLKTRLEVASAADSVKIQAAMPKILDMFQTYIREMRPEELRGSSGTYRLREELVARAQLAAAPARVRDVLFVEVLIQ